MRPGSSARRLLVVALVLGGSLLAPGRREARGDQLPIRTTGIGYQGGMLVASVGLQDLFSPAARERLRSGFSTRVLLRVFLRQEGNPDPLVVGFQRAEIVYDIWDEKFVVRVTRGPGTDQTLEVATADQAIAVGTVLWNFPVAERARLQPGQRYLLAIRGDLNPLSPELQAEVRRWLRQPAGAQRRPGAGGGDSLFGSFVTVFVNPQIDDSEQQVRFASQVFTAPAADPRPGEARR